MMQKLKNAAVGSSETTQALKSFVQTAFEEKYAFALWKFPHNKTKHFIIDLSGKEKVIKPDIENLPPGFLVSPFLNEGNSQTTYIKADLHYQFSENNASPQLSPTQTPLAIEKFEEAVHKNQAHSGKPNYYIPSGRMQSSRKEDFISLTEKAIAYIRQEKLEKIVPAKVKLIDLPEKFDHIACYNKLCDAYPHAMVSMIATPDLGTWIGATPEILVSMDKNGIFRTMSLAGTQKLPKGASSGQNVIAQASWTEKEIEEQALVSRYIINCFKKIRLREYEERGPKTVLAGNLMHLKTDFTIDTKAVAFPELPTVMLDLLHPTSAVCGMPREASLKFLKENEPFDRKLFSGYLGPVNIQEASDLYVNLRCMQLLDKQAAVFAGAGVTANSDPEKEWAETELKCETLLNVLE